MTSLNEKSYHTQNLQGSPFESSMCSACLFSHFLFNPRPNRLPRCTTGRGVFNFGPVLGVGDFRNAAQEAVTETPKSLLFVSVNPLCHVKQ